MEVILGVLIGIAAIIGIIGSRLITTFVHELGHAISALVFTNGPVEMYVGSHGDTSRSVKLKMGRLTLFLSFIIWDLEIGLCRHHGNAGFIGTLIIIFSGPFLSLMLGIVLLGIIIWSDVSDGWKFVIAILMISSIWDFFVNVIPRNTATVLNNGHSVHNDGKQLQQLLKKRKLSPEYFALEELVNEEKYDSALALADKLLAENPMERSYHELKLEALYFQAMPKEFILAFDKYVENFDPLIINVARWAESKILMHEYDEVIEKLTEIIYNGKGNYDLYFQRGRALVELGEYHDAMRDFHALTLGEVEDPRALANRAYCQYRLGYDEEAREDVDEAIENGKTHLGEIYFLAGVIYEKFDEEKALRYYKKAVSLKYSHHGLSFNISRLEKYK